VSRPPSRGGRRPTPPTAALALALLALLRPGPAAAQTIRGSAHDLSSGSTAVVRSTSTRLCEFCHTPHGGGAFVQWSHRASAYAGTYAWSAGAATGSGTALPTSLKLHSRLCLGCHDGTVALGDLVDAGLGPAVLTVPDVATAGHQVTGGKLATGNLNLIGAGGSLGTHHPLSIPYAGQATYNGISSGVPPAKVNNTIGVGTYWTTTTAGCTSATGLCTTATGTATNGAGIQLYPDVAGTQVNLGLECSTCHEPHNRFGFAWLLRADNQTTDGLCRSCHHL
jgi:predicted CXXCH cytochrome family protein